MDTRSLGERTAACLRGLGVHTLRDLKQDEPVYMAGDLPAELRGWKAGDSEDGLSELAACLAAWLGDDIAKPTEFWEVLLGCARRNTRHLEQGLVFGLWHTMLCIEDVGARMAAAQCYAALLCVPGSTAHRVFQQEAYLCDTW